MRTPQLITAKGIASTGHQLFLEEPHWEEPEDELDVLAASIEGAGILVQPDTASAGDALWLAEFLWRPVDHVQQRVFYEHQAFAMGRLRSFWIPSWRSDFNVVRNLDPSSGRYVFVQPCGFDFAFKPNRYGMMIEDSLRRVHVWLITGYDETLGALELCDDLDLYLPRESVLRCCLVRRVRFEADGFDWRFATDGIVDVTASVTEVLGEGVFV